MPRVILTVPHVQQRQLGECLAACAGMMLSYLGLAVSYDQLTSRRPILANLTM